ncbi:MAG: YqjF family protein [Isosphaeraceae bacterium]
MTPTPPETMDRLSPTRRPQRRVIMYQKWRSLLFLHWEVPANALGGLIPPDLSLDLYDGKAYVGLVPFTMRDVRPVGLPAVGWLSNFHETNVRTYVHHEGRDPGVWFFSLEAANSVAVVLARTLFSLPYHRAEMSLERTEDGAIRYASTRRWPGPTPATSEIRAVPTGEASPARPGTLEHFLLERYLLYAVRRGRLHRGQVHHTPYPVQSAEVHCVDETLLAALGVARPPVSPIAHYAEGVDVEIFPIEPVPRP